jgi:hypothetical protein
LEGFNAVGTETNPRAIGFASWLIVSRHDQSTTGFTVIVHIDYASCVWLNEDRPNGKLLTITASFGHASLCVFGAGSVWHVLAEDLTATIDFA